MSQENKRALDMLKTALEMEEKGRRFYEKAVNECPNDLGKEIFELLKNEELKHIKKIREIYAGLQAGNSWSDEWTELQGTTRDAAVIFRKLAQKYGKNIKSGSTDLEALDIGLEFEAASVEFYEKHCKTASDPSEFKFVKQMAEEERRHYNLLEDLKFYYTDPEGWMMEKGKAGLDGA